MSADRTDRELLLLAAKAMGWDTTHSANTVREKLVPPSNALWVRRREGADLITVTNAWNPLDAGSVTGPASALELAAHFRIPTGYDDRFAQFGECAYASYRTGVVSRVPTWDSKMVNVKSAGGPVQAMCRAIVLAVVAQYEAGQC